jgi:hypothetical protein
VAGQVPADEEYGDMLVPETMESDDMTDEVLDKYLNAELMFEIGSGNERKGRVLRRAKGSTG